MENNQKAILGVFPLQDAKQLKAELAKVNVELDLVHNPETCSQQLGKVTIEAHVDREHIQEVAKLYNKRFAQNLGRIDFDSSLLNEVFDPSKAEATCPACGTKFQTTSTECPDCGLMFG